MRIQPQIAWVADNYRGKLFEDETLRQAAVKPSDKDNFILHPSDDKPSFIEANNGLVHPKPTEITPRVQTASHRRIKSASSVRLQDRPWHQNTAPSYPAGFTPRRRPTSAVPPSTRPMSAMSGASQRIRRVKSAGSSRKQSDAVNQEILDEMRSGFYLVNKLYENEYSSGNIRLHPASPAPDYRYFDRHSRCYNHTHAHQPTNHERPQRACERYLAVCGSRAVSPTRGDDPYGQTQRYVDYHRPRTAPGTRKELQYIPRPTYVYRGHTPHFCNFVQQVHLHSKQLKDVADSAGIPDSDIGDDLDFIESYEGRIGGKYRKGSNARVSGTEGRPGSPSSLDGGSQNEGGDSERLPVTGVDGSGTHMMIPEEDGTSSNDKEPNSIQSSTSRKKSIDKATQSSGFEDTTKVSPPLSKDKPPPTPQPIPLGVTKPQPPTTPAPERKRSCVTKKTRKPIERSRKMKEPEEVPVPTESPKVEDREPTPVETESGKPSSKLELQVPDLPPTGDTGKKQRKEKSKPKRHLIEADNEQPKAVDAVELLNEQNRQIRSEIDWSTMDTNGMEDNKRQPQIKSWIQGRLALSQQSSRFELPMDMKRLEKMTPQEYVRKHCIITSRRNNLYQKIFMKNKEKSHTIVYKDLDKTLKEVLVNTITSEQIQEVLRLLDVNEQTKVDFKLFAGMAAYAERILYPKYVTEDTVDMPEYQKEKIESADFSALDWKFHGVNVNPQIKTLLKAIS